MKQTLLTILFFSFIGNVAAQFTHGLEIGTNYSWHNQTYDYEIHSGDWGYGVGYKFAWQFNPKWELSVTPSVKLHYVTTKYVSQPHPQYYDINKAPTDYASIPICIGYTVWNKFQLHGGYQYSYKMSEDFSESNPQDHAVLLGLGYDFGFVRPQIIYQQSLNTMERVSYYGLLGEQIKDIHKYSRLYAFNFSLFIPLNRKKGWDE
jgi:predicted porin